MIFNTKLDERLVNTLIALLFTIYFTPTYTPAYAEDFAPDPDVPMILEGYVSKVLDGDTLRVVDQLGKEYKVRLSDIDAPEINQSFGNDSLFALYYLCHHQPIKVTHIKYDRYERIVGDVSCNDTDASAALVEQGYAWVYRRYSDKGYLPSLEEEARENKRGLWQDPRPTPPWKFRQRMFKKKK